MILGNLVLHEDQFVADYVQGKLGCIAFTNFTAIGVRYQDAFVGGVVYFNYYVVNEVPVSIEASFAFEHPGWCRRGVLRALFAYPFNQLGVARFDACTARKNKRSRKVLKGLGFREEGVRHKRYDGVDDLVMYGMLRDNCRWIKD